MTKKCLPGCNAVNTRLETAFISLKPVSTVPQGFNAVKTWLVMAFIPLKPAPAQRSYLELMDFSNVLDFDRVYSNDDITFFSCVLMFSQALK